MSSAPIFLEIRDLIHVFDRWRSDGLTFDALASRLFSDVQVGTTHLDLTAPPEPTHKLNTDRTVAVATDYYWNEDMRTCPLGAKVQLLGVGGVASYGNYNGRDPFWVMWAPLPKRRTA